MMKLEEQVLSIDQMQHLKELGVEVKDNAMVLDSWGDPYPTNTYFEEDLKECIPTLTLQEIFSLLPKKIEVGANYSKYLLNICVGYQCVEYVNGAGADIWREFFHGNLLNAAYETLCWVAENGYLNEE